MIKREKNCRDCKHFNFYYFKGKEGYYKSLDGICGKRNINKDTKRN